MGCGTGLEQQLQLRSKFLAPESWPWAPARPSPQERQQEADWKSQLAASCAHSCAETHPPGSDLTQRLGNELREQGHEGRWGQLGVS